MKDAARPAVMKARGHGATSSPSGRPFVARKPPEDARGTGIEQSLLLHCRQGPGYGSNGDRTPVIAWTEAGWTGRSGPIEQGFSGTLQWVHG